MFLIDNPSIRGEEVPDYTKNATWKLFRVYIDSHSQILIDGYLGYIVQAISILQSLFANMALAEKSDTI